MYKSFFKPLFDFGFALIGLLVLSPLLVIAIVCLFFANNGKPFFFKFDQVKTKKNSKSLSSKR